MKNKIQTETVSLPAYWASALINDDNSGMESDDVKQLSEWCEENRYLSHCLDCSDCPDLKQFNGPLTDCLDFTFHVQFTEVKASGLEYLIYPACVIEKPLPWQKMGLHYSASGYGAKIPTPKMAVIRGRKYRIYCSIFSNVGTCWINFHGRKVIFNQGE